MKREMFFLPDMPLKISIRNKSEFLVKRTHGTLAMNGSLAFLLGMPLEIVIGEESTVAFAILTMEWSMLSFHMILQLVAASETVNMARAVSPRAFMKSPNLVHRGLVTIELSLLRE
jgi:hypothetical protein